MQAILVPIDNRPVTYVFPQMIARIAGVKALVPPRHLMGSLSSDTQVDALNSWLSHALKSSNAEALLVCIDSIIYGGLIPSRRTDATATQLLDRAKAISKWKKESNNMKTVFAQSSIMRISDNYDNIEEKAYWSRFGREIFAWSEALHRLSESPASTNDEVNKSRSAKLQQLEARIETAVREDYLATRRRNFQINKKLLDYAESGEIDFLIYSQDDSGQYGLNVLEKQRLLAEAKTRNLKNVIAYAGADEVLMTMLARWLVGKAGKLPRIKVSFSPENGGTIGSRYEGQTIGESVNNQLAAAGLEQQGADNPDLHFVIHTSGDRQGDHIWLPGHPDMRNLNTGSVAKQTIGLIAESKAPVILCDLAYSNGADPLLVEALLEQPELLKKLWGFAGWNTSGNTLGSAIATGIARWYADLTNQTNTATEALKEALFVRFADDWAYQSNARAALANDLSPQRLDEQMAPLLQRISKGLGCQPQVKLSRPWQRSFEVEIGIAETARSL